jgi:hypothetical protein
MSAWAAPWRSFCSHGGRRLAQCLLARSGSFGLSMASARRCPSQPGSSCKSAACPPSRSSQRWRCVDSARPPSRWSSTVPPFGACASLSSMLSNAVVRSINLTTWCCRHVNHYDILVFRVPPQRGGGFPSGHTAVATTLTVVGRHLLSRPAARVVWAIPILVGGARQYVGAHLPLDVVGGVVLGLSAGTLANRVLRFGMIG